MQAKEEELAAQNEELKAKEEELAAQNEELQNAHKQKNRFLSTMSHELRTPLNAILGFSQSLNKQYFGELNEKQIEYVNLIENSGNHLLLLINDLLDLAKIDAGVLDIQIEELSPATLIEESITLVAPQIEDKSQTISYQLEPDLCTLKGDFYKTKQVIMNLLSNAVKYTPEGGSINLRAYNENNSVKIEISDTGIGIKEEDINNIFSEFYQSDKTRDQAMGGTGIGLALCKRLIEIQNGEIGANSEESKGSIFWFKLPCKE